MPVIWNGSKLNKSLPGIGTRKRSKGQRTQRSGRNLRDSGQSRQMFNESSFFAGQLLIGGRSARYEGVTPSQVYGNGMIFTGKTWVWIIIMIRFGFPCDCFGWGSDFWYIKIESFWKLICTFTICSPFTPIFIILIVHNNNHNALGRKYVQVPLFFDVDVINPCLLIMRC